jgi:hypothetical protein
LSARFSRLFRSLVFTKHIYFPKHPRRVWRPKMRVFTGGQRTIYGRWQTLKPGSDLMDHVMMDRLMMDHIIWIIQIVAALTAQLGGSLQLNLNG